MFYHDSKVLFDDENHAKEKVDNPESSINIHEQLNNNRSWFENWVNQAIRENYQTSAKNNRKIKYDSNKGHNLTNFKTATEKQLVILHIREPSKSGTLLPDYGMC